MANMLPYEYSKIAQRLRALRESNKLSREKMSTLTNIGASTIKRFEKEGVMDIEVLWRLAEFFNVSTDYLLCRTDFTTVNNEMISQETGLNDAAIENIKYMFAFNARIKKSCSLALEKPFVCRDNMAVMNAFISSKSFGAFILSVGDYFVGSSDYTTPVVKHNGKYIRDEDYKPGETPFLYLASDDDYKENVPIPIDKTFLQGISIRKMEGYLKIMETEYNQALHADHQSYIMAMDMMLSNKS